MNHIAVLGRQPFLGLAELESVLGPDRIKPFSDEICIFDGPINIDRFGGIIKTAEIIDTLPANNWQKEIHKSVEMILKNNYQSSGKISIGLSLYGSTLSPNNVQKTGLSIKKKLKTKASLRIVPNKTRAMNAGQIIHNKLLGEKGFELIVAIEGSKALIALTDGIQDIEAYAERDRAKPVRDALVGMLPPKVAQMLINYSQVQPNQLLLDPFCGTGTLLMEAMLIGINAHGSDLSTSMVEASRQNTKWLQSINNSSPPADVQLADARSFDWQFKIDAVASETYLGPPLKALPDKPKMMQIIEEIDNLHREFLLNVASQLSEGQRLALAVPAWQSKNQLRYHLPIVDDLEKLGYNRSSFKHVKTELIYRRPDQIVAREILILTRI